MTPNTVEPHHHPEPDLHQFNNLPSQTVFGSVTPPVAEQSQQNTLVSTGSDEPVPVVKVLSTRGVEYAMMTITLWIVASTLAWVILNLVNGSASYDYLVVPISALIVCVPVFGFFFLRLRKAELANPSLRFDPSKRRWSQTSQLLAFIICIINLIIFVYNIMQQFGGNDNKTSLGKSFLNMVVILFLAGGVLTYYWFDEHRSKRA